MLSPLLFNLYSEEIFKKPKDSSNAGMKVNGERIALIRYANDTVLLASSEQELQTMLDNVPTISEEYGVTINERRRNRC